MMNFSDLFPNEDYRFHMGLRRGNAIEFFGRTSANGSLIAERQRWLASETRIHSSCLPEATALLDECVALAHQLAAISDLQHTQLIALTDANERCAALGRIWEPDFLLLKSNSTGPFQLLGGCVCFPSSWSLAEKIGRPLEMVHGVVPSLNAQIGPSIQSFLAKLAPGVTWLRHNWGLSRSPELNQHPQRALPKLDGAIELSNVWLRVEHQALTALPKNGGILFGIRVVSHPLAEVKAEPMAAAKLVRSLQTMPAEVAAYKGVTAAREQIVRLLQ
jgi:hypothetical protein